jgi:hypothetical protein
MGVGLGFEACGCGAGGWAAAAAGNRPRLIGTTSGIFCFSSCGGANTAPTTGVLFPLGGAWAAEEPEPARFA